MVRGMGHVRPPRPHRLGRPGTRLPGRELIHRDYSDETAHIIDEEVTHLLDQQAAQGATGSPTCARLGIAAALLEHETLDATDITKILAGADRRAPQGHVDVESAGTRRRHGRTEDSMTDASRTSLTLGDHARDLLRPAVTSGAGRHAADDRSHAVGGVGGRRRRRHRRRAGGVVSSDIVAALGQGKDPDTVTASEIMTAPSSPPGPATGWSTSPT